MSRSASKPAAVLGSPISHSKSPQLHTAAYRYLGLSMDYSRIELGEDQISQFLDHSAGGFTGFSVTMPLKSAAVGHMTTVSERVKTLGVLNTIGVTAGESGALSLHGENTDVDGIVSALGETGLDDDRTGRFVVIGAGATAAAALAAGAELGFTRASIYARSPQRAAALLDLAPKCGLTAEMGSLEQLVSDLSSQEISAVVSTLPPGAADTLLEDLRPLQAAPPLLDVAYDPWPSPLAQQWHAAGGAVVSGLQMLLHQAVKQVEIFTASTQRPAAELDRDDHAELVTRMRAAITL